MRKMVVIWVAGTLLAASVCMLGQGRSSRGGSGQIVLCSRMGTGRTLIWLTLRGSSFPAGA